MRTGGESVQLPCAGSANMPMLSPSLGWSGMVLPMTRADMADLLTNFEAVAKAPLGEALTATDGDGAARGRLGNRLFWP